MGEVNIFENYRRKQKRKREEKKRIAHVEVGMTLKHYSLEEKIGQGAIAYIFGARNINTGEQVSIKAIRENVFVDPRRDEYIARFEREVKILSDYDHPNLVNIRDYGEDRTLFYVMDYIEGKDLCELISDYRTSERYIGPKRAIAMAITIASVLIGMHKKGTFHRDLKSENVMVEYPGTENERFILIDLGFGKITKGDPELTGKNEILGTLEFMPPEELERKPFDARSDIYSLATVLYETLCNRPPFVRRKSKGETKHEFVKRKLEENTPPITKYNPNIHPEINRVVMRALEKDPDKRPQNCEEFIAALEEVLKHAA
jgi:serine/threonine-protein kinase